MISVIAACPQSFFQKDSRQVYDPWGPTHRAGMTYNVTLLMNSLVTHIIKLLIFIVNALNVVTLSLRATAKQSHKNWIALSLRSSQ